MDLPTGLLRPSDIAHAREVASSAGQRIVDVLDGASGLAPDDFVAALGRTLSHDWIGAEALRRLEPDFSQIDLTEAVNRQCFAALDAGGAAVVVFADPFDLATQAWVEERLACTFTWRVGHTSEIVARLKLCEDKALALDAVRSVAATGESRDGAVVHLSLRSIHEDESPIIRLVNSTIYDALKSDASDIHFETDPGGLVVKCRLDGVLVTVARPRGVEQADQVLSRLKVMAELDIAERRVPQDGRFQLTFQDRPVDFRVSVMPSIHGEDAVLRVLDKQSLADEVHGLRFDNLGLDSAAAATVRSLASMPYGMLLVTGPTGSGKTTTLYAAVTEINTGQDKIITIEDPVEYQLPGVLQIPVNEKKGLSFARGLRSILRHDPDKILVGEVRDAETAQIAVQAALTGHLVLTTVHANSVFDVIGRICNMGVDPFSFASATNGIVAQRLVRQLCEHCAEEVRPSKDELVASRLKPAAVTKWRFRVARGCGRCRGSGYRGRRAVVEVMLLDDELRELIVRRESMRLIREAAQRTGTRSLRLAALDLVRHGVTSLQEVNRVTAVA
ncbi:MAG: GspE/PulE family protein [Rhizobacter sp.]|nr:GspE/PulE family protein [Rhizobacter sp.]